MSFASFEFLVFLPIVIAGYWALARLAPRAATAWLVVASLTFYARGGSYGLPYLFASAAFNCWLGFRVSAAGGAAKRRWLQLGAGYQRGATADREILPDSSWGWWGLASMLCVAYCLSASAFTLCSRSPICSIATRASRRRMVLCVTCSSAPSFRT